MKRILLLENHEMISVGVQSILYEQYGGVEVDLCNTRERLPELLDRREYDLMIFDPELYGVKFSLFLASTKQHYPTMPILAFSNLNDLHYVAVLIKSGANGFLPKNTSRDEFIQALQFLMRERIYLGVEIMSAMISDLREPELGGMFAKQQLSALQLQISKLLVQGLPIKDIAERLGLSSPAVSNHKTKIFSLLNVKSLIELNTFLKKYDL